MDLTYYKCSFFPILEFCLDIRWIAFLFQVFDMFHISCFFIGNVSLYCIKTHQIFSSMNHPKTITLFIKKNRWTKNHCIHLTVYPCMVIYRATLNSFSCAKFISLVKKSNIPHTSRIAKFYHLFKSIRNTMNFF